MKLQNVRTLVAAAMIAACVTAAGASAAEPQMSPRMEKAKDYIADEQWVRAVETLRAAAADAKEKHRDEALFWLAHSQHQARDLRGAVETIARLEREFPTSRWTKPAGSLRVELAQKLRNDEVLWYVANGVPAPTVIAVTPAPPAPRPSQPGGVRRPPRPATTTAPPAEAPLPPPPPEGATPAPLPPRPAAAGGGGRPRMLPPPTAWVATTIPPDGSQRLQALGSLLLTDAPRVIPLLREIALESNSREASRAVFLLAQCGRPDAHLAVLEVARVASEPVSVAAVRELGRFGGENTSRQLLEFYAIAKPRVKYQVVHSLGERAAAPALMQIVQSESDQALRDVAIVTLGQAGGRQQLRTLYGRGDASAKRPVIVGLFNARAEEELIRIAERESDVLLRREIHEHLRLLGTAKAKAYLEKVKAEGR